MEGKAALSAAYAAALGLGLWADATLGTPSVWPASGVAAVVALLLVDAVPSRRRPLALVLVSAALAVPVVPAGMVAGHRLDEAGVLALLQAVQVVVFALLVEHAPRGLARVSTWHGEASPGAAHTAQTLGALGLHAAAGALATSLACLAAIPLFAVSGLVADRGDLGVLLLGFLVGLVCCQTAGQLVIGRTQSGRRDATLAGAVELGLLATVTLAVYWVSFWVTDLPLIFLPGITVVWAALRLDAAGAAVHGLFSGALALVATYSGHGALAVPEDPAARGALALGFLVVVNGATVALSAARQELSATNAALVSTGAELVGQRARLDAILDSLEEGVVVLGSDVRPRLVNPAAAGLMSAIGVRGHALDIDLRDLDGHPVPDDDQPALRALAGERVIGRRFVLTGERGRRVIEVSAVPLDTGADREVTVVLRDVTGEQERLSELESFAGVVAHDLKGPLAIIGNFLEVLELSLPAEVAADPSIALYLRRIAGNAASMNALIEDLLVHVTSRNRELEPEEVDLRALVGEIASVRDAQDAVSAEVAWPVLADRVLVRHLLDNLVGNALRYVDPDTAPRVRVHAERAGSRVRIAVEDNGIGIPDGERELVFQEFRRVGGRSQGGTGLGLAICRTVVERHGGAIHVEPGPDGVGSRFVFTLPAPPAAV